MTTASYKHSMIYGFLLCTFFCVLQAEISDHHQSLIISATLDIISLAMPTQIQCITIELLDYVKTLFY